GWSPWRWSWVSRREGVRGGACNPPGPQVVWGEKTDDNVVVAAVSVVSWATHVKVCALLCEYVAGSGSWRAPGSRGRRGGVGGGRGRAGGAGGAAAGATARRRPGGPPPDAGTGGGRPAPGVPGGATTRGRRTRPGRPGGRRGGPTPGRFRPAPARRGTA